MDAEVSGQGASRVRPWWTRELPIVVMAVLAVLPGLGFLSRRIPQHLVADADLLLLHELLPDLASGGSLTEWYVPAANYVFPDWPLYGIALVLGPTPAWTIAIFAMLQVGLLAAVLVVLARQFDRSAPAVLALITLGLVVFAVLWTAYPLVHFATSYIHAGSAISGILLLALVLSWTRRDRTGTLLLAAALTFAGVFSDSLFVIWAVGPGLVAVGLLALVDPVRRARHGLWLAAQCIGTVLAYPIPGLLFPRRSTDYGLELGFQPRFGLGRFIDSFDEVRSYAPLFLPGVVVAAVVLLVVLLRGRSLFGRALPLDTRLAVAAFVATATVGTVASQIALVGGVPPNARYSTFMLLLPIVLAPMVSFAGMTEALRSPARRPRHVLAAAATALPLVAIAVVLPGLVGNAEFVPVPVACVESALGPDSTRGIASYWDARPFQVYSDGELVMVEHGPELAPFRSNANGAEITGVYDFAVVSELYGYLDVPADDLRRVAGEPRTTTECFSWTVLDYGRGGLRLGPSG